MNTSRFIKEYCKPTTKKADKDSLNKIMSHAVDYETIREYLVAIEYSDYLKTFYWKSISQFVRSKYKECPCGEQNNLHVHHKTYFYVGIEHIHIDCLQVLCDKCHSLIHSCEKAPKSSDRGVGYEAERDKHLKKFNKLKTEKKNSKQKVKPQNQLIFELYVKNRMYTEMKRFKKRLKSDNPPSSKEKYMIIKDLIKM